MEHCEDGDSRWLVLKGYIRVPICSSQPFGFLMEAVAIVSTEIYLVELNMAFHMSSNMLLTSVSKCSRMLMGYIR